MPFNLVRFRYAIKRINHLGKIDYIDVGSNDLDNARAVLPAVGRFNSTRRNSPLSIVRVELPFPPGGQPTGRVYSDETDTVAAGSDVRLVHSD